MLGHYTALFRRRSMTVLAGYSTPNVWPEFLHEIRDTIPHVQHSISSQVSGERAIFGRMVDIRQACGRGVPQKFGVVNSTLSGIRSRNKEPPERIKRPVGDGTFAELVIARVLVQHARQDGGGHVGPDSIVGKGCAVALPIRAPT